ncbi:hypothetical protein KP79_PYT24915 [Mizuhopecten yessoensis]|uniref:Uncharacterized protein n=1 Tax=Mizuhopecten yessoensis TaxID=6573 RepID=A0A210Q3X0_MIZYE|nr:hypothetical protein KP79_PYT24915 [Mizuhopecten yessoensis]
MHHPTSLCPTDEELGYLAQSEDTGPGVPSTTETLNDCESRFKKVTDVDLKKYEEMTQSKSTKKNTKWELKIFQG